MFTLKPWTHEFQEDIEVADEARIPSVAQSLFDREKDEASPNFVKGVYVYEGDILIRHIENPSIDPFEGL